MAGKSNCSHWLVGLLLEPKKYNNKLFYKGVQSFFMLSIIRTGSFHSGSCSVNGKIATVVLSIIIMRNNEFLSVS